LRTNPKKDGIQIVDPTGLPRGIFLVSRPATAKPAYHHFAVYLCGEWDINVAQDGCYYPVVAELNSMGVQMNWYEGDLWTAHGQVAPEEELRALWRLEMACAKDPDYALLVRNCEQFARWVTTGTWESKQVQTAGFLAIVAAFGILVAHSEMQGRRTG
jgi:hypothetical protein